MDVVGADSSLLRLVRPAPKRLFSRGVANIRGVNLADAQAFIRECYGADANLRVIESLSPEVRRVLEGLREVSWYPLNAFLSYLVAARALLDPRSEDFYRRQGRFGAKRRRGGPLIAMVATRALRMRMAPVVFRMFYDVGHLEVVGGSPEVAFARIHGFPATPELCERFCGVWEGLEGGDERSVRAVETRCVLRGDPFCELHVG
jgi:hypothetical protein